MGKKHNSLFQLDNFCSSPSSSRISSLLSLSFWFDFGWLIPCFPGSCEQTDPQIFPSPAKITSMRTLSSVLFCIHQNQNSSCLGYTTCSFTLGFHTTSKNPNLVLHVSLQYLESGHLCFQHSRILHLQV